MEPRRKVPLCRGVGQAEPAGHGFPGSREEQAQERYTLLGEGQEPHKWERVEACFIGPLTFYRLCGLISRDF